MDKNKRAALEYDLRKIIGEATKAAQEGELVGFGYHERFKYYENSEDLADIAVTRCLKAIDEHQGR